VSVDGHRVPVGVVGDGPPALFLHGWGMRPATYRPAIEAMARAGCRVYATSLPGFGGTAELPAPERSFAGYAAWVGRYLDVQGLDAVGLVAGHSFGGGVATAFTHDHPRRVRALLLANAIGSPAWVTTAGAVRTMAQRPIWDWGRHLGTDLLHSPGMLRHVPAIVEDLVPNVVHHPLSFWRTGSFIRSADLVGELRVIAGRGHTVQVVWSDRDRLVPRAAFDDLRRAAGVPGLVVEGSHSWLIGDPGHFGDAALFALVDAGLVGRRPTLTVV